MTRVRITPLRADDAAVIARLQDELWRTTYSDLLPARVLRARDEGDNATRGRARAITHEGMGCSPEGARTLVAHDEDGVAIGWASVGPPRDDDPPTATELWSLYVAAGHHGSGVAGQLVEAVLPSRAPAHLWVLDGNARAIAFYRKVGFAPDGAVKSDPRLGADEVRMVRLRPAG